MNGFTRGSIPGTCAYDLAPCRLAVSMISTALALSLLSPGIARANDEPALEEVVVTAQKRSESIQDVPLSITAITSQEIESAGIASFGDYATKVPNLSFNYGEGQGVLESREISIRGIQGADTTGFYIDDLPLPTTLDPRVIDLDRIEVLRGPQGTLYGARSMGGTVRLITTPPDPTQFTSDVHVMGDTIDGGGNGGQADATVNLPLWKDRAALRLTVFTGTDGGFINREFPDPSDPATRAEIKNVAETQYDGAVASILLKVTDNFTVRPLLMYQWSNMNGLPLADYSPDHLTESRDFNIGEQAEDRWTYSGLSMNYATPVGDITSATSVFDRRTYEAEDDSEFTAYAFGTPPIPATIDTTNTRHSFVEELRFASKFPGPVQFVGGLYFDRSKLTFVNVQNTAGLNAASGGALGTNLVYTGYFPQPARESAAFGELTYKLTDKWSVTAGLRYSQDVTSFQLVQNGLAAGGYSDSGGETTEHSTTPKGVIQYEANSHVSYYVLAAKGFRPGAAQTPPPASFCAADYASSGLSPGALQAYHSDSLWNYEVGAKSTWFDRKVTLNGALFWIDWTNLQQQLRFDCGYTSTINSGKAESRGGELELAAIPIENLTLTLGLGYTDAKITQAGALVPFPSAGQPIQQVAPWTNNVSVEYSVPLGAEFRGLFRSDYSYTDHSFSANNNPAEPLLRQSYQLLNLRFGVMRNFWQVAAFVKNATDAHPNLGDEQDEAAELPGRPRIFTLPPRTYGLEARVKF